MRPRIHEKVANSGTFVRHLCLPTLDFLVLELRIKIVGKAKSKGTPVSTARAKRDRSARPYTLRVVRDHGGGLWTFESDSGQMYLAVLSREVSEFRQEVESNRRTLHLVS